MSRLVKREGGAEPLTRLSIVEIQPLQDIALDVCSEHPDDPSAAQQDGGGTLQRKRPGATIFGLVDGTPMETLGQHIIMYGRTALTDSEAGVPAAISVALYSGRGLAVDPDDYDDLIDGDLQIVTLIRDPGDQSTGTP